MFDDYKETSVVSEIVAYLNKYTTISKSKVNRDAAKKKDPSAGILKRNKEGVFTGRLLEEYVDHLIKKGLVFEGLDDIEEDEEDGGLKASNRKLANQKLMLSVEKETVSLEERVYDFEKKKGKHLLKSDVYKGYAGRLLVVDNAWEHWVMEHIGKFIEAVGGDHSKTSEGIACLMSEKDNVLRDAAETNLEILVNDDDNEEFET